MIIITVAAKGDTEPERNETRSKVDEDRKHEYPYSLVQLTVVATYLVAVFHNLWNS